MRRSRRNELRCVRRNELRGCVAWRPCARLRGHTIEGYRLPANVATSFDIARRQRVLGCLTLRQPLQSDKPSPTDPRSWEITYRFLPQLLLQSRGTTFVAIPAVIAVRAHAGGHYGRRPHSRAIHCGGNVAGDMATTDDANHFCGLYAIHCGGNVAGGYGVAPSAADMAIPRQRNDPVSFPVKKESCPRGGNRRKDVRHDLISQSHTKRREKENG